VLAASKKKETVQIEAVEVIKKQESNHLQLLINDRKIK